MNDLSSGEYVADRFCAIRRIERVTTAALGEAFSEF